MKSVRLKELVPIDVSKGEDNIIWFMAYSNGTFAKNAAKDVPIRWARTSTIIFERYLLLLGINPQRDSLTGFDIV